MIVMALLAPLSAYALHTSSRPWLPSSPRTYPPVYGHFTPRLRSGTTKLHLADVFAPALGVLTSNALYFTSLPTVLAARKSGSLGPFNPLPSTIMVISAFSWLCYGLAVANPWVVASNLPGAAVVLAAFVIMLPIMGKDHKALEACQIAIVGGATTSLCIWTWCIFSRVSAFVRAKYIGYFASAIFVTLAASPLSTIRTVISERDSASIYAPLTVAQCANTLLWTIYGMMAAKDIFVYGPNAVGLALGVVQLLLKLIFPSKD